jgi:hypothetical protein
MINYRWNTATDPLEQRAFQRRFVSGGLPKKIRRLVRSREQIKQKKKNIVCQHEKR